VSTDEEWEKWGRQDPYYGVITDERYRAGRLTAEARAEFFASGEAHVEGVITTCRRLFEPSFAPKRALDFGCGVGRVLVPLARISELVVGADVSRAMLEAAERHCTASGVSNVYLVVSDDALTQVQGQFDLIHSTITLQHIEVERGLVILTHLLHRLAPGGIAAIQLTYAKAYYPGSYGQPPAPGLAAALHPMASTLTRLLRRGGRGGDIDDTGATATPVADPEMLMNPYPLSEVAYLLQTAGIPNFHAEFTDHGGELGVFIYFQKPKPDPSRC
jgi:SAM-dependent methyltransferase